MMQLCKAMREFQAILYLNVTSAVIRRYGPCTVKVYKSDIG